MPDKQTKRKKCRCASYNRPDLGGDIPSVTLQFPFENKTVCIDACIVDEVKKLWDAGIYTLNSCCGHNGVFGNPSIIVNEEDSEKAKEILGDTIDIMYWGLQTLRSSKETEEKAKEVLAAIVGVQQSYPNIPTKLEQEDAAKEVYAARMNVIYLALVESAKAGNREQQRGTIVALRDALLPLVKVADVLDVSYARKLPDTIGLWTRQSTNPADEIQLTLGDARRAKEAYHGAE